MREQLKQQFKGMIATLARGEAILYSRIEDTGPLHQLLEDMQNSAMAIGTTIEQLEGEGSETVKHLENYCDLLWRYMTEEDLQERLSIAGLLAGEREAMGNALDTEYRGRLEIAFLVCRGAAWKQMERFFHIMKDQADCYVITAPYMEQTGHGEGSVIHDDTDELPEEVETEELEQYDIRERKPDMLFIDGPYAEPGQPGLVPGYDFAEIREHAEMVLYLPYYEDESQVSETDCSIVQVRESDIILVPSEKIGSIYAGAMEEMEGGSDMAKKIYVLQSFDGGMLLGKGMNQ